MAKSRKKKEDPFVEGASSSSKKVLEKNKEADAGGNFKDECTIWVVEVDSTDNNRNGHPDKAKFQESVFARLEATCLAPQWIKVDECLKISQKRNEIFVLSSFSGDVFKHLCSLKCRIYGSLAVMSCLNAGERLPKWTHPIQSVTLRGAVICFTGFDYSIRETQTALILRMDGLVSRDLNTEVTHLVAMEHNTNSRKYNAAAQHGIPVMSLEWLEKAWEATTTLVDARFTDSGLVEEYRLKLFTNCLMTCSGVSMQDRLLLGQLIEQNGGKFKGDMERRKCTHLLTDLNSGEKYRKAREWGWDTIKIVRVLWLAKCIEKAYFIICRLLFLKKLCIKNFLSFQINFVTKGYRLPERLFEPKIPIKCSTPINPLNASPANLEFSAISGQKSQINGTLETATLHILASTDAKNESRSAGVVSVVEQTNLGGNKILKKTNSSRILEESAPLDPIINFDFSSLQPDDFLEGCRVFFCGIGKGHLSTWKRLATLLGASISSSLNNTITHVVIGTFRLDCKIANELKETSKSYVVVKCEWLLECAKTGQTVASSDYTVSLFTDATILAGDCVSKELCSSSATVLDGNTSLLKSNLITVSEEVGSVSKPAAPSYLSALPIESSRRIASEVKTPVNKLVKHLQSNVLNQTSNSVLIGSPSAFLNPKKNFIPRFDLHQAYEYVNELRSFEQSSNVSEHPSWSESVVGNLLNQAVAKTSKEGYEDCDQVKQNIAARKPDYGFAENDNVGANGPSKKLYSSSQLPAKKDKSVLDEEKLLVSNEEKMRMIQRGLANLADYEGKGSSDSAVIMRSRKRSLPDSDASKGVPLSKRLLCNEKPVTVVNDSHESGAKAGIIGWEEADQLCGKQLDRGTGPANVVKNDLLLRSSTFPKSEALLKNKALLQLNRSVEKEAVARIASRTGERTVSKALEATLLLQSADKRKGNFEDISVEGDHCNVALPGGSNAETEKRRPTFLLSSLDESKRRECAAGIAKLGGDLRMDFDEEVNFLICGEVVRNEKLLTSIACGVFILEPEYVNESIKVGKWLQPELFEWGRPECMAEQSFKNKTVRLLAAACRRWRIEIGKSFPKKKAFFGWNVLLYCSRRRSVDIGRIISFGGGISVLRDDVELADGFTHALIEKSKYWNDQEINALAEMRLNCYNMDFIANFLTIENIVEKDYFHPDYLSRLPQDYVECLEF